jgi:hypothetical protein
VVILELKKVMVYLQDKIGVIYDYCLLFVPTIAMMNLKNLIYYHYANKQSACQMLLMGVTF